MLGPMTRRGEGSGWRCVALVCLLAGCGDPAVDLVSVQAPHAIEPAAPKGAPLVVEYAGCVGGERQTNSCELSPDGVLALWVAGPAPKVDLDGVPLEPTAVAAVDGGTRLALGITARTGVLTVQRAGALPWSLRLIAGQPTPRLDAIAAKLPDQNATGRGPALDAVLREVDREIPQMGPYERAKALRMAMVVAWDGGKDATPYGARALEAALALGDAWVIVDVANIYTHVLGDDPTAHWVLDVAALYSVNVGDALSHARLGYALAASASRNGDVGDALERLRATASLAMHLSLDADEVATRGAAIGHLARLGRVAERDADIARVLEVVDRGGQVDCNEAMSLINISTSLVFERASVEAAERVLERVLAAFAAGPQGCEAGDNAALHFALEVAHGNMVLASIVRRDWDAAAKRLAWFDGRRAGNELAPSLGLYRAEVALARGDARGASQELASTPESSLEPRINWRRAVTLGHAEARLHRTVSALAAYARAEATLDGVLKSVDVDEGREGVGLGLRDGTVAAITLLAELGRIDEAAVWARRSRARALRPVGRARRIAELDAQTRARWHAAVEEYEGFRDRLASDLTEAWRLPTDERAAMQLAHATLREQMRDAHARAIALLEPGVADSTAVAEFAPPPAGELWLVLHPDGDGWIVFASSAAATRMIRVDRLPPQDDLAGLGAALIEPFVAEVAASDEVRILAMEGTVDIPFHELSFLDGVLVDAKPVAWVLDIGTSARGPARTRALVVGDPASVRAGAGALARAREEAELVATALGTRGYEVDRRVGVDATFDGVIRALPDVDWFHYAGHGVSTGVAGWESALPLAGEAELGVRDVLTASAVPRAVVLSGCSTAATQTSTAAGGLSVAAAFVLAGSEFVIGSSSEIADEDALDLAGVLYRVPSRQPAAAASGSALFRDAVRDGRRRNRHWTKAVRVWVP